MPDFDPLTKVLGGLAGLAGVAALYDRWLSRHAPKKAMDHTSYEEAFGLFKNCQEQIAEQNKNHDRELSEVKGEFRAEMARLREETEKRAGDAALLAAQSKDECDTWRDRYWTERTVWETDRAAMVAAHRADIERLIAAHRADMELLNAKHRLEVDRLNADIAGKEQRLFLFTADVLTQSAERDVRDTKRDADIAAQESRIESQGGQIAENSARLDTQERHQDTQERLQEEP